MSKAKPASFTFEVRLNNSLLQIVISFVLADLMALMM